MRLRCIMLLAVLLSVLLPSLSFAQGDDALTCPQGPACLVHKVDFGEWEVACSDGLGDEVARWRCQFDTGFLCSDGAGDTRKGGYLPLEKDICAHLCGPCPGAVSLPAPENE